jgi:SAM-dependent methyltransferase
MLKVLRSLKDIVIPVSRLLGNLQKLADSKKHKEKSGNTIYSLYKREYKPVVDMHHDKSLQLSIQSLEETNYECNTFDFVTSLSVIEHGVDIHKYFMEMNRILKKGGLLLTSTD